MQIVGAGLSKTGTKSLHYALTTLGYKSINYDNRRLNDILDGSTRNPDFRRYDDIDAVVDLPAAFFFEELLAAYPDAKCILTHREEDSWWRSVETHFNDLVPVSKPQDDPFRWRIRTLAYGSSIAEEGRYRRAYREHNARVRATVPRERLLVMDIVAGQGWETLCPFLGVEPPDAAFPHRNKQAAIRAGVRAKRRDPSLARNAPCPCGSGLKYKRCHGRLEGL